MTTVRVTRRVCDRSDERVRDRGYYEKKMNYERIPFCFSVCIIVYIERESRIEQICGKFPFALRHQSNFATIDGSYKKTPSRINGLWPTRLDFLVGEAEGWSPRLIHP